MPPGRLTRDPDDRIIAGVCSGVGRRYGVDPLLIRVITVVVTVVTGGVGAIGYGLLWAVLPAAGAAPATSRGKPRPEHEDRAHPPGRPREPGGSWAVVAGAGFAMLGLLFIFRETGVWWSDALVWPLVIAAGGVALIWRQLARTPGPEGRRSAAAARSRRSPAGPFRGGFGIALLLGGALLFLYVNGALSAGGDAALAALTAVIVIGLLAAPLWARSSRALSAERAERIRSGERTEMAAHLHDSVLQTLALIQKNPEDSRRISTLARSQERELREWLSGKRVGGPTDSLAEALESAAAEVEERHQVPIEVVTVGDRPLDQDALALVAAGREAMTNAARHAGDGGPVRLYVEIDRDRSQVFVHDRGPGFDPRAVPADRRGVRDSILGRMESHGGSAEIRSVPGEGTEIELVIETK